MNSLLRFKRDGTVFELRATVRGYSVAIYDGENDDDAVADVRRYNDALRGAITFVDAVIELRPTEAEIEAAQ